MIYKKANGAHTRISTEIERESTRLTSKVLKYTNDLPDILTGTITYGSLSFIEECNKVIRSRGNRKAIVANGAL